MTPREPLLDEAQRLLDVLAPGDARIVFQTFDDDGKRKSDKLARKLIGTLDKCAEQLIDLNTRRAGVFLTVNQTDGKGRTTDNIVKVRAVFADVDGAPLAPILACGLAPHALVESSPGRWHVYWRVSDCPKEQFGQVQKAIAARFGTDKKVFDLPRVMRLPGFWHQKEAPFQTRIIEINADLAPYRVAEIIERLGLRLGEEPRQEEGDQTRQDGPGGAQADADGTYPVPEVEGAHPLAVKALRRLSPDPRDQWIAVTNDMRAIERMTGASWPRELWRVWSELSPLNEPGDEDKWDERGVGTRSSGLGALCARAGIWDDYVRDGFEDYGADWDPDPDGIYKARMAWSALAAVEGWSPRAGNLRTIEPVEFAVEDWVQRGQVGLLIAEGGTGKTTLQIYRGACHTTGRRFFGQRVVEGTFVLLSRDDSQEDLDNALAEVIVAMGLTEAEVEKVRARFRLIGLRGKADGLLIEADRSGRHYRPSAFAKGLIAALARINDLVGVVFDTGRQFTGVDSVNEAAQMVLMSIAGEISALPRRPFAEVDHHTGKEAARNKVEDMYAAIGSSALADNARYVLRLRRLDADEITELHLPPDFAIPIDGDVLKLTSTRGSLRVKTPAPILYTRIGFRLERIHGARQKNEAEKRLALLRKIAEVLSKIDGNAAVVAALLEQIKVKEQVLRAAVRELLKSGLLARKDGKDRGPVYVTEAGWAALKRSETEEGDLWQ